MMLEKERAGLLNEEDGMLPVEILLRVKQVWFE